MLHEGIYTKNKIKIVTKVCLDRKVFIMCGIVGYVGKNNAIPTLLKGLKRLEYRGYDSAGIAYLEQGNLHVVKAVGKIDCLENKLNGNETSFLGIGHTRWATHGKVSELNCHPHKAGDIVIVHNGILENYQELKQILLENGYTFYGDTDSEVAAAYIDYLYQKNKNVGIVSVLNECVTVFEGSYAIVGMIDGIDQQLFLLKKDSPLVIGVGDDEVFVASDTVAYHEFTSSFVFLEDLEVGVIENQDVHIYQNGKEKEFEIFKMEEKLKLDEKENFSHYMLKEIFEQVPLLSSWNENHLENLENLPDLGEYQKIHIVACGTAYHAGLIGKYLIEEYGNIEVQVFIASEYRYQKLFINRDTLVIFVSQSGETADTLACLKRVKTYGATTLGIVNVKNSSIARSVAQVLYTNAGPEIAVASTKAYLSQIYIFSLLAFRLGIQCGTLDSDMIKKSYWELPRKVQSLLEYNYEEIAKILANQEDMFFLGRNIDYVTMMEGALKLKEISYIHAEVFQAGELKHGTISLIEDGTPVLALLSKKEVASKTLSNVEEVKSRGAKVFLLVNEDLLEELALDRNKNLIVIPSEIDLLQPLLNVIPLQMIAYEVARVRGVDIDKPRNLAKSVTVE